jgi:hypothetical protein
MSTVRRTLLYGMVRYGTESMIIRTILSFIFMLLIKTKIYTQTHTHTRLLLYTLWYETVRLVRRTEEEKYGTVGTDIWEVLLLPT